MDINNLYQDSVSYPCGFTAGQFTTKVTQSLDHMTASENIADSYLLGYAYPSSCPIFNRFNHITADTTSDSVTVDSGTPSANFMIGYCMKSGDYPSYCFNDSGVLRTKNLSLVKLPNDLYPEFYGMKNINNAVVLYIYAIRYVPQSTSFGIVQKSFSLTFSDFIAFINGDYKITYTDSSLGNFQFTSTDFTDSDTAYFEDETTGYGYRLWLFNYSILVNSYYNGGDMSTNVPHPYAFVKASVNFDDGASASGYRFATGGGWIESEISTKYFMYGRFGENMEFNYNNERIRACGLEKYTYTGDDFPEAGTYYTYPHIVTRSGVWCYFYQKYTFADVEKSVGLQCRVTVTNQPSYHAGFTFATDVDETNRFELTLKTGNLSDESFKSGLRKWQYVDIEEWEEDPTKPQGITTNEFVEEDAPPYDPTPPTPGGEEGHNPDNPELSLGDTEDVPGDSVEPDEHRDSPIQFPVSAFMTQYILDANQIYNMGRALWSGMGDSLSQMASNFVKTYTSTGTINIANLMDFFVSVKCFPFDMTAFDYGWQAPAMTVGTGAVPILNESVWVLGVSTYTVDCGTVATTENAFKLGVNSNAYDFRNYVNCTISCFLPYCGTVELNPADVFPYTLSCKYFVDMLSGSCTAVIWAERPDGSVPVASKTGQIGKVVPISATNVMGVVGQAISGVSNIFQTVGEVVISAAKRRALGATQAPINEASKNKEYLQEMANYNKSQTDISNKYSDAGSGLGVITGAASGIGNLMTRNGVGIPSLGAGVGLEAMHISERPYIVIRRLNYSSPNNYAHTTGFATTDGGGENNKSTIGAYSGWTVFQNVDLSGICATKEELDEIKMLLETGVYL